MGRYEDSRAFTDAALVIARAVGNEYAIAESERLVAYVELAIGARDAARAHMLSALERSRRIGNKVQLSSALNGLAEMHRADGDLAAAAPLYEESATISRASGDRGNIAVHLANLVWTRLPDGRIDDARAMLHEALSIVLDVGAKRVGVALLDSATGLAAAAGDATRAATLHGAREAIATQLGYQREPADEASLRPLITGVQQVLGPERFEASCASGRALSYEEAMDEALRWSASSRRG